MFSLSLSLLHVRSRSSLRISSENVSFLIVLGFKKGGRVWPGFHGCKPPHHEELNQLRATERQASTELALEWRVSLGIPVRARERHSHSVSSTPPRSKWDRRPRPTVTSRSWVKFPTDGLTINGARKGGRQAGRRNEEGGGGGEINFFLLSRNGFFCYFICLVLRGRFTLRTSRASLDILSESPPQLCSLPFACPELNVDLLRFCDDGHVF